MKHVSLKKLFASVLVFFKKCGAAIMNWWEGLFLSTGKAEGDARGAASDAAEAASFAAGAASADAGDAAKDNGRKFFDVLLAVPDVAASLCLCAAVVVALRPQLLSADFQKLPDAFSTVVDFGSCFFKAYIKPKLPAEVLRYRNFFVILFLFLYLFGKVWVIAFSGGRTKKALSVLFISMTLLSCTLVADKFLIFVLFILLLFMGFQYSLGVTARFARRKFGVIILLALAGYAAFVFCADKEALPAMKALLEAAGRILSSLSLPIQSWL